MAAVDDPKTLGRTRLSFASEADIDEFVATLEKFESGELTPDQWRVFRLVRGTYGQRQAGDVQMLRIKIPQGVLTQPQLVYESAALMAKSYYKDKAGQVGSQTLGVWKGYVRFLFSAGVLTDADGKKLTRAPDYSSYFTNAYLPRRN